MWILSDEEMIKITNRMNDVWNAEEDQPNERLRAADRLVGALDALLSPSHYYSNDNIVIKK